MVHVWPCLSSQILITYTYLDINNGPLPFRVPKTYQKRQATEHFCISVHFVIFGPKNHQISLVFPVSNQHCQNWKFHFPKPIKNDRLQSTFERQNRPLVTMLKSSVKTMRKSMVFRTTFANFKCAKTLTIIGGSGERSEIDRLHGKING